MGLHTPLASCRANRKAEKLGGPFCGWRLKKRHFGRAMRQLDPDALPASQWMPAPSSLCDGQAEEEPPLVAESGCLPGCTEPSHVARPPSWAAAEEERRLAGELVAQPIAA